MSGSPLTVSCVIPVYNGAAHLGDAIDSVLGQTRSPTEVIVVDDGSTDATPQVAKSYGDRIRYVRQQNRGPAAARNRGADMAEGEILTFLDADDLWAEEKLDRQLERLETQDELDLCWAHAQNFWVEELGEEARRLQDHARSRPLPGYVTGTLAIRAEVFHALGGLNEDRGHADSLDLCLRLKRAGTVSELLSDVLLYRRIHGSNRSRRFTSDSLDEFFQLIHTDLQERRHSEGDDRS